MPNRSSQAITLDPAQQAAAERLDALARALKSYRPGRKSWLGRTKIPRGLYIWGDVGRGKSMLMDMFFEKAPIQPKRRVHFNAFMVETHARIHAWRNLDARARARRAMIQLRRRPMRSPMKRHFSASTNSKSGMWRTR